MKSKITTVVEGNVGDYVVTQEWENFLKNIKAPNHKAKILINLITQKLRISVA